MEIKIDVKMQANIMYDFMIYHAYRRSNGYMGPILGTIALMFGIRAVAQGDSTFLMWFFFSALFFLLTPVSLYTKAKAQVLQPRFKEPIHYIFTDEFISVMQQGEVLEVDWEEIQRAVSTRKSIILYTTKVTGFILPREAIGMEFENLLRLIAEKVPPKKVNIK